MFILGDVQNLPGHGPEEPLLADTTLRREVGLHDLPSASVLLSLFVLSSGKISPHGVIPKEALEK